jgi:hypothetical protein
MQPCQDLLGLLYSLLKLEIHSSGSGHQLGRVLVRMWWVEADTYVWV